MIGLMGDKETKSDEILATMAIGHVELRNRMS